jgi:ABC-type multidrug transport system fused ATPase/permease subunit
LLDRIPTINTSLETREVRETAEGHAALDDVKFAYPSRPNQLILKGLNLEAKPGQTVALVGKSGCGKSTVMGLLERWYDPSDGTISFDKLSVSDYNLKNLRSFMAIVGQEPILFNISIRDNIAYGALHDQVDDMAVYDAAKMANIHDFIMTLPEKYDTLVGEKGGQLSGGKFPSLI